MIFSQIEISGRDAMDRCDQTMNLFWVMTHELLGHFYLKLTHGKGYKSYQMESYAYERDQTLLLMNDWRMDLGLPTRLQHPPRILRDGATREYIFVDYAPDSTAFVGTEIQSLPSAKDRRSIETQLRNKVQNQQSGALPPSTVVLPDALKDSPNFPIIFYVDDDADKVWDELPKLEKRIRRHDEKKKRFAAAGQSMRASAFGRNDASETISFCF